VTSTKPRNIICSSLLINSVSKYIYSTYSLLNARHKAVYCLCYYNLDTVLLKSLNLFSGIQQPCLFGLALHHDFILRYQLTSDGSSILRTSRPPYQKGSYVHRWVAQHNILRFCVLQTHMVNQLLTYDLIFRSCNIWKVWRWLHLHCHSRPQKLSIM
jgi:hypothetical protein